MKAISNATPIIGLSIIGHVELLWELFDIYIPQEVYNEVVIKSSEKAIGKQELKQAVDEGHIAIHNIQNQDFITKTYGRLHKGELEVIIGAIEIDAHIVIIDEKAARTFAKAHMLKPLGLLGILKLAKAKGKIKKVKPLIDSLVANKFRISKKLTKQLLTEVGEA